MSVLSYLQNRASDAVLAEAEKTSINRSIETLQKRLNIYFESGVLKHFRFGSSTRDTILPRLMDEKSDIDYMVVFSEGGYNPQAYLDRLKRFVNAYYSTSEIYQSSPTIVLELNHIRFDLVPALIDAWTASYKIPKNTADWQITNPNDFNKSLEEANKRNSYLIKPTIRLAKFWNANCGYVFDSYSFEKWIKDLLFYSSTNQRDYLFNVFDNLSATSPAEQWRRDKINRAKEIIAKVREYEGKNMPFSAEGEVKKLIP
jgi:hypothetical protein